MRNRSWRRFIGGLATAFVVARLLVGLVWVFGVPAAGAEGIASGDRPRPMTHLQSVLRERQEAQGTIDTGKDGVATVVLFGDSLAYEAGDAFVAALTGREDVRVVTAVFGGTAICDWFGVLDDLSAENEIDAAVVEFSGNSLTSCMRSSDGELLAGEELVAKYGSDAPAFVSRLRTAGATVFIAGAPQDQGGTATAEQIRSGYEALAQQEFGVYYVDAGSSVLADGVWTESLPCLEFETAEHGCVDGLITVRAPDGLHFCPGAGPAAVGVTEMCPRWSSGAYRFGTAMAAPVLRALPDAKA